MTQPSTAAAVRFELGDHELPDVVRFRWSPLLETLLSLHVLAGPEHHSVQHPWVRAARDLPPELRRRLAALSFVWQGSYPCAAFPSGADAAAPDFRAELERLRRLDPAHATFEFGLQLTEGLTLAEPDDYGSVEVVEHMLAAAAALPEPMREPARLLVEQPASFLHCLCDLLEEYWDGGFAQEWQRIEPLLRQAVDEGSRRIAGGGLAAFLADFAEHAWVDDDGVLRVRAGDDRLVAIDAAHPLVLCPSIYVWPHVGVNRHEPFSFGVLYPAPAAREQARPVPAPPELAQVLQALADDTRLRVLRMLAQRPRTTQELAPLVPISEAGLSKQLQHLARAGLVTQRRHRSWVLYELDRSRLDMLGAELAAFLES